MWICDRCTLANDLWSTGGDEDMVCGSDVCDELNNIPQMFSCMIVMEINTDEVAGATLLRDDAGEEMAWYEKFKAFEEVSDETCVSRTGRKPISFDGAPSTKVTMNVWKYEADWSHAKSNRKGQTATSKKHHCWHSYVT